MNEFLFAKGDLIRVIPWEEAKEISPWYNEKQDTIYSIKRNYWDKMVTQIATVEKVDTEKGIVRIIFIGQKHFKGYHWFVPTECVSFCFDGEDNDSIDGEV